MRRRVAVFKGDNEALRTFEPFVDDFSAPYWERVAAWEEWTARRDDWLEQRQLFADAHGWPGGELERLFEECYVFADRPWDPRIEPL